MDKEIIEKLAKTMNEVVDAGVFHLQTCKNHNHGKITIDALLFFYAGITAGLAVGSEVSEKMAEEAVKISMKAVSDKYDL